MQSASLGTNVQSSGPVDYVQDLVARAREAMAVYAREIAIGGQARIDEAVTALAWSLYKPENARRMAEIATTRGR
mgnify:FL=1